jgi:23S rRNA-/tRNA-specific pseudouridylate synthase
VRLEPVTGRTNQLRIHCAHVGHPISGDGLYGRGGETLRLHARRLEVEGRSYSVEASWD